MLFYVSSSRFIQYSILIQSFYVGRIKRSTYELPWYKPLPGREHVDNSPLFPDVFSYNFGLRVSFDKLVCVD